MVVAFNLLGERLAELSARRAPAVTSLLEIEDLDVTAAGRRASMRAVLHDVSLAIAAGEAVGLVGESGSGKSMTARAVDRLLPARRRGRGQRHASTGATC